MSKRSKLLKVSPTFQDLAELNNMYKNTKLKKQINL